MNICPHCKKELRAAGVARTESDGVFSLRHHRDSGTPDGRVPSGAPVFRTIVVGRGVRMHFTSIDEAIDWSGRSLKWTVEKREDDSLLFSGTRDGKVVALITSPLLAVLPEVVQ